MDKNVLGITNHQGEQIKAMRYRFLFVRKAMVKRQKIEQVLRRIRKR